MREAAQQVSGELRGVLVPMPDTYLLLPNAAVAEVVNYQSAQPIANAPNWLKGYVGWRGEIIPLLSVESLLERFESSPGPRARILVCNSLGKSSKMSYYGILSQALPRMIRLTAENLAPSGNGSAMPWVLEQVSVAGTEALIPDLDAIEQATVDHLEY